MKKTAALFLAAVCVSAACQAKRSATPVAPSVTTGPAPFPRPEYPGDGDELVAYIVHNYPERLVATRTYQERARNMEFVRDQMVHAGICGGMDLARNLKRGVGPLSADAIAWRPDGVRVEVVDIAASWDDFGRPLRLHWMIVGGPPGWSPVAPPVCD
jgi:hypothetical protein